MYCYSRYSGRAADEYNSPARLCAPMAGECPPVWVGVLLQLATDCTKCNVHNVAVCSLNVGVVSVKSVVGDAECTLSVELCNRYDALSPYTTCC